MIEIVRLRAIFLASCQTYFNHPNTSSYIAFSYLNAFLKAFNIVSDKRRFSGKKKAIGWCRVRESVMVITIGFLDN
jgi:hypothetical protein